MLVASIFMLEDQSTFSSKNIMGKNITGRATCISSECRCVGNGIVQNRKSEFNFDHTKQSLTMLIYL